MGLSKWIPQKGLHDPGIPHTSMYKQYDYRVLYVLKEGGFETHTSPLEVKVGGTFHFALSKERGASES